MEGQQHDRNAAFGNSRSSDIKDDPECLAMFREAMKEQAGRPSKESADNVSTIQSDGRNTEHGNSRAYSIDGVKRECEPEVVAKVMEGQQHDRNAAGNLADGIPPPPIKGTSERLADRCYIDRRAPLCFFYLQSQHANAARP